MSLPDTSQKIEDATKRYKLNSSAFVSGVERLAKVDPEVAVTIDYWDSDPLLLGTPGGTVDFATGPAAPAATARRHHQDHRLSRRRSRAARAG